MKNWSGFEVHPKRKILLGCISISRNRFLQVYKSFFRSLRFPGLARLQSVNAVNRRFYFVRSEREFRLIAADSQSRFLFFTIRIIKPYHGFLAHPFHGKQGDPFSFDPDLRVTRFSPVFRRRNVHCRLLLSAIYDNGYFRIRQRLTEIKLVNWKRFFPSGVLPDGRYFPLFVVYPVTTFDFAVISC